MPQPRKETGTTFAVEGFAELRPFHHPPLTPQCWAPDGSFWSQSQFGSRSFQDFKTSQTQQRKSLATQWFVRIVIIASACAIRHDTRCAADQLNSAKSLAHLASIPYPAPGDMQVNPDVCQKMACAVCVLGLHDKLHEWLADKMRHIGSVASARARVGRMFGTCWRKRSRLGRLGRCQWALDRNEAEDEPRPPAPTPLCLCHCS